MSSHLYDPEDEELTNCWEEKQYRYNDLQQKVECITYENGKWKETVTFEYDAHGNNIRQVCGYVYEGDNPPEECPKCHQKEVFEPVETAKNPYSGTKTEKNLLEAFAGESQARNKYNYFASVAKKAGFEQIAALFLKTAQNEKEHAELWFKALGLLGDTAENLESATDGENYE